MSKRRAEDKVVEYRLHAGGESTNVRWERVRMVESSYRVFFILLNVYGDLFRTYLALQLLL
jgi:hypothetical protein